MPGYPELWKADHHQAVDWNHSGHHHQLGLMNGISAANS